MITSTKPYVALKMIISSFRKYIARIKKNNFLEKYRSEITKQSLDYPIDPAFRNINRLCALSFNNGNDDTTRNFFDEYYMPLVEIKDFNALIDNKPFFDQPAQNRQEAYENLSKCQEIIIIRREIYKIICIIKIIINLLA